MRVAVLVAPIALFLAACASPVPVAENFPTTFQKVARSAHHWDVVAADVVQQTSATLQTHPALKDRPIVIGSGYRATAFNAAFRNFLTNHMVNTGLPVNVCRATGVTGGGFAQEGTEVEVQYEVQLVVHNSIPYYRPGMLTALAAGVVVGRALAVSHFDGTEGSLIGLGLAAGADVALGNSALATRNELIVTTTIADQNRFIVRRSDIYYVPSADTHLFVANYSHPTVCPTLAQALPPRTEDDGRYEMYARGMRRSNLSWRPESSFMIQP